MKYAINFNSVIPVRRLAAETSEMVTQLLFGEVFIVKKESEKWCEIENAADNYSGWIDTKTVYFIEKDVYLSIVSNRAYCIFSPTAKVKNRISGLSTFLACGSQIHFYNEKEKSFSVANQDFLLLEGIVNIPQEATESLSQVAKSWLNVPYLWGGKTVFGIDCSGFVQIIFSLYGINLPRDAKDQCEKGFSISYAEAQPNDLVFFCNEQEKIIHVGIVLENNQLIHASGKVKIDYLTADGIFSEELNQHTHTLFTIKRVI